MIVLKKPLWLLFAVSIVACERVEYFPDRPIIFTKTVMIAHQGGGFFDAGNTFEACVYGLERMEGIEVDIQKSLDNDLWLSHSSKLMPCGELGAVCFSSVFSQTIITIDSCLGNQINYTRLEKIFDFTSKNYPDKFISLDVKVPPSCNLININTVNEMNEIADVIIDLSRQYNLEDRVMVESEMGDFLYRIKKKSKKIETYLVTLGDFELGISRALHAGFSGISYEYTLGDPISPELIELMHRKGLKIQLWTIKNAEELEAAKALKPDFIQTDWF
jgi:glycerophosphoryl diester phosphodiesterase